MMELAKGSFYKPTYYKILLFLYRLVGRYADLILVNSSWTQNHINNLWRCADKTHILFPPCNVTQFSRISLDGPREDIIVSYAQFRPEKNQKLQIYAFKSAIDRKIISDNVKLVIMGGCRGEQDKLLKKELQDLAEYENIGHRVEFKTDLPLPEVLSVMSRAKIGIHTMWNEHFGIGVVEMMAAGLITIAHYSGGPLYDIIKEDSQRGYLGKSTDTQILNPLKN